MLYFYCMIGVVVIIIPIGIPFMLFIQADPLYYIFELFLFPSPYEPGNGRSLWSLVAADLGRVILGLYCVGEFMRFAIHFFICVISALFAVVSSLGNLGRIGMADEGRSLRLYQEFRLLLGTIEEQAARLVLCMVCFGQFGTVGLIWFLAKFWKHMSLIVLFCLLIDIIILRCAGHFDFLLWDG